MKKILMVTLEFPPMVGGIASYVEDLVKALPSERVVVLAPPAKLLSRWFWPRWLLLAWRMWRLIKKEKIEIVIIHHILPVGYAALIAYWLTAVPFIIFSHGTDIAAASRRSWKRLMVRIICNSAIQIVMNSESLKRRFLIKFNAYESKTIVVYPCPNEIFFKVAPVEKIMEIKSHLAIEGRHVILSVARMIDGKGFPHLVRVIKDVAEKIPNITWLIIGTGPKLAEIIELVQKNSLQNIVRFIGEVPHAGLPVYYQVSTVFTLLTHPDNGQEEGLGLVFLEAAASGLPCVAGKSGGVEEAVVHGQTGFVFDVYQNQKAITDAIIFLLTDPAMAHKLGQHGRERIRAEFNSKNQLSILKPWFE